MREEREGGIVEMEVWRSMRWEREDGSTLGRDGGLAGVRGWGNRLGKGLLFLEVCLPTKLFVKRESQLYYALLNEIYT